jgi:hypothetical protein
MGIMEEITDSYRPCFNEMRQFKYSGNFYSGHFPKLNDKAKYPIHVAYIY